MRCLSTSTRKGDAATVSARSLPSFLEQLAKSGVETAEFAVVLAAQAEQRAGGPETPSAIPAGFSYVQGRPQDASATPSFKALRDKGGQSEGFFGSACTARVPVI